MEPTQNQNSVRLLKSKLGDAPIVYLDGNTFAYKDILKKHNAKWNGTNKIWFWFLGKDPDRMIQTFVKPALEEIKRREKLPLEIDEIINALKTEDLTGAKDYTVSNEEKSAMIAKLEDFKKMLINIDNDEEFKEVMGKLMKLQAVQGTRYSLANTLLIFIQSMQQGRKTGIMNSASNWKKHYNRKVVEGARPFLVWTPAGYTRPKSKEEKAALSAEFYKKINKRPGEKLDPSQGLKLDKLLRADITARSFPMGTSYSQYDTVQIEGTEDYIKAADEVRGTIKWFEENMISDEVRPVYKGLLKYAEDNNIKVELVDDLNGARGVSKGKLIQILRNEGNDVGVTKTLTHEIIHELFHWKSGKYYLGDRADTGTVEQQAEISAWMFMHAFGFDVKTTSLNYAVLWGADKNKMLNVFNTVVKVVNDLIKQVNINITSLNEGAHDHASFITADDVARFLGLEKVYQSIKSGGNGVQELFNRLNKKIK